MKPHMDRRSISIITYLSQNDTVRSKSSYASSDWIKIITSKIKLIWNRKIAKESRSTKTWKRRDSLNSKATLFVPLLPFLLQFILRLLLIFLYGSNSCCTWSVKHMTDIRLTQIWSSMIFSLDCLKWTPWQSVIVDVYAHSYDTSNTEKKNRSTKKV